jgi:hypothetical protein
MTVGAYRDVDSESNLHFLSAIEGSTCRRIPYPYVFAGRRTVGRLDVNFRNYLPRICSSWASPEKTQGSPFHDLALNPSSNHSRSWVILSASQRFRLLLSRTSPRQSVGTRWMAYQPPTLNSESRLWGSSESLSYHALTASFT